MYHSVIGKRLVECVNRREGTAYSVRDFFDSVYVPLFFGSARMLQYVNNSPFDQAVGKQKKLFTEELIKQCLHEVHNKVESLEPDASFFLGGPSSKKTDGTSGQVTALPIPITEEDIYASWIGAALGLTVQGGMILLIDAEEVLLTTYDGWSKYKEFLEQTPTLKPLQVNAWNGQWVGGQFFDNSWGAAWQPVLDGDNAALTTQKWVQLIFALSYHYRNRLPQRLTAYVYSLGQSNTTLGFVRLNLAEVEEVSDLYRNLFTVPEGMYPADFERLYDTAESFRSVCAFTEIGLRALRPKDAFKAEKGVPTAPKSMETEKRIAFDTYQTWIIAMLNNKDLMPLAGELAQALNGFRQQDTRMKSVNAQQVEELLGRRNRRDFIEELAKLVEKDSGNCNLYERVVTDLMSLSPDNVPLFLTLLRFQYAAAKAKS